MSTFETAISREFISLYLRQITIASIVSIKMLIELYRIHPYKFCSSIHATKVARLILSTATYALIPIKFYGKIHFNRDRSENSENNMHCHLIVSRKDQSNKKKLSPLTNHKNTRTGTVKGGFDRTNLFRHAEHGFDKLFSYNRPLKESFEYYNTMKNGSISEQLKMQEKQISHEKENKFANSQTFNTVNIQTVNQDNKQNINLPDLGLSSALGLFTPDLSSQEEEQAPLKKKKKIPKKGIRR